MQGVRGKNKQPGELRRTQNWIGGSLPGNAVFIPPPLVTRLLSTSKPTAGKSIDILIKAGVLREVGERKRDRLYRYERYLRLLD